MELGRDSLDWICVTRGTGNIKLAIPFERPIKTKRDAQGR
jgi:hypothetical protein